MLLIKEINIILVFILLSKQMVLRKPSKANYKNKNKNKKYSTFY